MKQVKNVPELRFPGFDDEWEEKKLGSLTTIKTGSSDVQDAEDQGKYPFFIRSETIKRSNQYTFDGEAILIPGEGRLGEIYHYVNGKFNFHQRVYKISNFSSTYGLFIFYKMQNNFKEHALKHTVKATVDSLRLPMLTGYNIYSPSLPEQQLIGDFFQNIDKTIELQQVKIDNLKLRKNAMLQKMFPQDGEVVPRVRFPGFDDEWEERRLADISLILKNYSYSREYEVVDGNVAHIHYGDIHSSIPSIIDDILLLPRLRVVIEDIVSVLMDDVVMADASEDYEGLGKMVVNKIKDESIIAGLHTFLIRPNQECLESLYLLYFSQTDGYKKHMLKVGTGASVFGINKNNTEEIPIKLPSLPEQQLIGDFFKQLDESIELNERKLHHLKERKKTLLKLMFV